MISGYSSINTRLVAGELYALEGNCGRKIKRWLTFSLELTVPNSTIELYFNENCVVDEFILKYQALSDTYKAAVNDFALEQGRVIQRHLEGCESVLLYKEWVPDIQALIFTVPFSVETAPIPKLKELLKAIQILAMSMQKYEHDPEQTLSDFLKEKHRRMQLEKRYDLL